MDSKKAVSERLREFGLARYGNLSEFARALNMPKRANLDPYLAGKSLPGFELLDKIRAVGCDLAWLMTGESQPQREVVVKENLGSYGGEAKWVEEVVDNFLEEHQIKVTPLKRRELVRAAEMLARKQLKQVLSGKWDLESIIK